MSVAQFKLDMFEGPLDLLLHLISKHKLNIYDIEISLLLEQYMDYINNLDHEDYEDAADFLEMAARLVYIKTCYLLPHDDEAKDLKKELEGRIIEYSLCKLAAQNLRDAYAGDLLYVRNQIKLPVNKTYTREHDPQTLLDAYMGISKKARESVPLKARMFEPIVSHKIVSVTSKIIYVLKRLYHGGECDMEHLYDGMTDKSEKVATFLAILELTKSGRIFINDENTKIYFNKASKNKKINSDFDNDENNVINEQEKALSDISAEVETKNEKAFASVGAGIMERKPLNPVSTNKKSMRAKAEIIAAECISIIAPTSSETISSDELSVENIDIQEQSFNESESVLNRDFLPDDVVSEEFEELHKLADITPATIFKPNYWSSRRYYWGYSPVGDDGMKNYWIYG